MSGPTNLSCAPKDVGKIARVARRHGWTVEQTRRSGRLVWRGPDGQTLHTALTPKDGGVATVDQLRRAGVPGAPGVPLPARPPVAPERPQEAAPAAPEPSALSDPHRAPEAAPDGPLPAPETSAADPAPDEPSEPSAAPNQEDPVTMTEPTPAPPPPGATSPNARYLFAKSAKGVSRGAIKAILAELIDARGARLTSGQLQRRLGIHASGTIGSSLSRLAMLGLAEQAGSAGWRASPVALGAGEVGDAVSPALTRIIAEHAVEAPARSAPEVPAPVAPARVDRPTEDPAEVVASLASLLVPDGVVPIRAIPAFTRFQEAALDLLNALAGT